MSSYFSLDLPN
jgi:serine/threonine protein kinase